MKLSSRNRPAFALTLGVATSLLVTMPSLAGAQSTDHSQHMQSMPGMQMPMKPAAKKLPPKKKAAVAPGTRKPNCQELMAKGKQASKQYAEQCARQPKQGEKKKTTPAAPMDHSKMKGMDHSKIEGVAPSGMEGMEGMDHSSMQGMDPANMEAMDHPKMEGAAPSGAEAMDHSNMQSMKPSSMEGMDHSQMAGMAQSSSGGMDHSQMDMGTMNMQGGDPPADARDPDYSDGVGYGSMRGMDMADDAKLLYVLFDNLEYRHGDDGNAEAVDAQAWYGGDRNKLWLKLDGERSDGRLGATRTEALWNHAIAAYWGVQAGLRHDLGEGPTRDWAAIGVQGLAPYWFDLEATAYIGQSGRTALRVEAEYELLFTQRLILQPDVEVNFYGKSDPARGIGSGLSDLDVGLRLRYEVTRKFAPYVGVVWSRKFGNTADYARAAGGESQETQLVAGIRIWF